MLFTHLSIVPVRAEASDRSEMVTQLLFGETAELLERHKQWRKIKATYDGYEGWIDEKQCLPISLEQAALLQTAKLSFGLGPELSVYTKRKRFYGNLPIGSRFYALEEGEWFHPEEVLAVSGDIRPIQDLNVESLIQYAYAYLGTPYLWGGKSNFGIDCSGFTQSVFALHGIPIPRDAYQQAEVGEEVRLGEGQKGDLAFFKNEAGRVIHVGIFTDKNKIIHAHGMLRIDQLDEVGIYNADMGKHTHRWHSIKRIPTTFS